MSVYPPRSLVPWDIALKSYIDDEVGAVAGGLSSTYGAIQPQQRARYVEVFDSFFGGVDTVHVEGQGDTTTITTTTAGAVAGATTITVASATGILAGVWLVNVATEQLIHVTGVAGTTLTIDPLDADLPNGSTVKPLWTDFVHLTSGGGFKLFYRHVFAALQPDGSPVFDVSAGDKVVLLGNSWGVSGGTDFQTELLAAFPGAVFVNVSIGGQTSAELLARFDTDVPADADYVVLLEPGVNDNKSNPDVVSHARNLSALINKTLAIGAVPIHLGPVPLRDWKRVTTRAAQGYYGLVNNDPLTYARSLVPSLVGSTEAQRVRLGVDTHRKFPTALQAVAIGVSAQAELQTGDFNTALGHLAQSLHDVGASNTAVGARVQRNMTGASAQNNTGVGAAAQETLTSGDGNTAVGTSAQAKATTAGTSVAIGYRASFEVTTGSNNVHIGSDAGYMPGGVAANATTTGATQVFVGRRSGQSSPTQLNGAVAVGDSALVGASLATALGQGTLADHARSVALGSTTATTATDQVAIGPRHFGIEQLAADPNAPIAGRGRLYLKTDGTTGVALYLRTLTGTYKIAMA